MLQLIKSIFILLILFPSLNFASSISNFPLSELEGNWFSVDGSEDWVLGIHGQTLIYQAELWQIQESKKDGKELKLSISNKKGSTQLRLQVDKKGLLLLPEKQRLSKTPIKNPSFQAKENPELQTPLSNTTSAIYQGFIRGYKAGKTKVEGFIEVSNLTQPRPNNFEFPIREDGSFYVELPMQHAQLVWLKLPSFFEKIYLVPSTTTTHFINLDAGDREQVIASSLFMGATSQINKDLAKLWPIKNKHLTKHIEHEALLEMPLKNYLEIGLQYLEENLQKLKGEDIVFVYLTGTTSPESVYKLMMPGIPGDHYRLSASQWQYLLNAYNYITIPRYMIVNKAGVLVEADLESTWTPEELEARFKKYLK